MPRPASSLKRRNNIYVSSGPWHVQLADQRVSNIPILAAKGYCSRSVGRSVSLCLCSHVFSRIVAAVDTKRGYVGMCNGRSAQQESGAALSKNSMFTAGA